MIMLSCMPSVGGFIMLIIFAMFLVFFRLNPLKCPKCGSIMTRKDDGTWYCSGCKKYYRASDLSYMRHQKRMKETLEKGE